MDINVMQSPTSKMSKKISNRLFEISNNSRLINTLFDLHDKWKHQNNEMDFNIYSNKYSVMIMRILRDIDNKIYFIKITKNPLGFQFIIDNHHIQVFVKGVGDDIIIGMKVM